MYIVTSNVDICIKDDRSVENTFIDNKQTKNDLDLAFTVNLIMKVYKESYPGAATIT